MKRNDLKYFYYNTEDDAIIHTVIVTIFIMLVSK